MKYILDTHTLIWFLQGNEALSKKAKITVLLIKIPHALRVSKLEFFHRDPFDRLIIAQSIEENLEVLTRDSDFPSYDIITRR